MSTNPEQMHTTGGIGARDAHDGNRYKEEGYDVVWQYGDFDGFSDQKRCPDCGFTVHRNKYGGHACVTPITQGARDAQVERLDPVIGYLLEGGVVISFVPDDNGEYVRFTDFESVRQERDALKSERDRLRAALEQVAALAESIDLSPCCGGSCMVATDADDIVGPLQRAARAALNQSDAQ